VSSGPDTWSSRTWSAVDFDVEDLVARKAQLGVGVSVVLPARNESATVEGVVRACRQLEGRLVDELVLMDGASDDRTATLAAAAGAQVYPDGAVLAEYGAGLGKGDSLWRALSVTSHELVVYVDTDIRNPHPHFVWGLLGPLLTDPGIALVKAFYERPVEMGAVLHPSGGGRVTELLARPLINLFWPALAGLVQPLSGEYAARRSLLEAIPFFTGYGVELGMLIDALGLVGAAAIGQVDLQERVHRNQSIEALSRMAFGIMQVAARRLGDDGRLTLDQSIPSTYVQFTRGSQGVHRAQTEVSVVERPPFRTLRPG
jgi:glucosyl-3-phosphoglycerate synthase